METEKTYYCWLSPSPGYEQHGNLYPISTILYFVTSKFGVLPKGDRPNMENIILTEKVLDILLRHDAENWAWHKTGDDRRPEVYDADYADRLFAAYKAKLAETGELDFTYPCAGIDL